eukprot:2769471-Prymnesium_polylepis.1
MRLQDNTSSTRRLSACASYEAAEAFEASTCEALVSRRGPHAAVEALGAEMPPPVLLGPARSGYGEATQCGWRAGRWRTSHASRRHDSTPASSGVAVVSTRAHEYDDCSTARRPARALRQFARAHWCDRSTARWSRACPGTPPLSAQPAGDTGGGGRSAAGHLGVAVVSKRAHEYDDRSTARRPRLAAVCASSLVRPLDR